MEKFFWSLDISTTNVGCALWNDKGELVELKHLELKINKDIPVDNREIHKGEMFKQYAVNYKQRILKEFNGEIVGIIIEAPLQNTPKNINTTALLLGFNGMSRFILYEIFNVIPYKISVHDSRKIFCSELVSVKYRNGEKIETLSFPEKYKKDKKLYVWEKVNKQYPNISWFYNKNGDLKDTSFDMSDSVCVGFSGLKHFKLIK